MREKMEEREKGRSARFKEPTVVKEPSSSLHLDTHKYKTQRFELNRREGDRWCSRFFLLLLPPSLSFFPSSSLCPLTSAQQIYFTFLPFLDLSQYLATLRHPSTGGHRSLEDTALSHP